ncbi:MAG TPA: FAD-dependent monooxygenase, partial [Pirellulales bacterium]|nr:FAD-dependent monooxygenase [Pirellulales bacterium]
TNQPREREFSKEERAQADWPATQRRLLETFRDYHEPVETLIRQTASGLQLNIYDIRTLPAWHKGRVALVGDAAHAVSPSSGQGASLALEDAMYLAKLLRESAADFAGALARFERDRRPRVERIVAEGRRRGDDKQIVGPIQAKIREAILTVVLNLFGMRGQDWMYSYQID